MDYGKLAYVKAEEIEAYLKRQNSAAQESASAAFYPHTELHAGYAPLRLEANGRVAITVHVEVTALVAVQDLKVRLLLGSGLCAYCAVTLPAGGRESRTLVACVDVSGDTLGVKADAEGLVLEEMSVLAVGRGVKLFTRFAGVKCDGALGAAYAAYLQNGCVMVKNCASGEAVTALKGGVFDLAVFDNIVYLVGCDDLGNLYGVLYDAALTEKSRVLLGVGAVDSLSLGKTAYGLTIAAVRNRTVWFAYAENDFTACTAFMPSAYTNTDAVALSKQSDRAVLILKKGEKLYVLRPQTGFGAQDAFVVSLGVA